MYVCFVTSTRGGFNYRPAYLTVIPSKIVMETASRCFDEDFTGTDSLVNESPPVLILVICLSVRIIDIAVGFIF